MENMQKNIKVIWWIKSLLASYIVTGILLLVLTFFMYKFELNEKIVSAAIVGIYVVSTLIGGMIIGKLTKSKRYLWGMVLGILYFVLLLLITLGVYRTLNGDSVSIVTSLILCAGGGMTGMFFQISPINTFVLCVVMRVLMGFCVGLIFKALRLIDRRGGWSYFIGALSAPLLNTLFFMGYIVLVFYNTEFIQSKVADLGAVNPLMFVVLLVGVQGLIEAIVCCAAGGVITRAVSSFLSTRAPAKAAKTAKTED